jgi:hypothetical protein
VSCHSEGRALREPHLIGRANLQAVEWGCAGR